MKFLIEKEELMGALNIVQRAVSSKSSIAALEGILIKATDSGTVVLTGNDIKLGIEVTIDANVLEPGVIVLGGKMFIEIVRRLPDDEVSVVSGGDFKTRIKCKKAVFDIIGIDPREFTEFTTVDNYKSFIIDSALLKSMVEETIYAVSQNESRPTCMGCLFEIENRNINIVAIDGFRMAIRCSHGFTTDETFSFIVPAKILSEITKILKGDEGDITFNYTKHYCLLEFNNIKAISRLIEGDFLDYRKLTGIVSERQFICSRTDLLECVDRTEPIITVDLLKSPLRLTIGEGKLLISCQTVMGEVNDILEIENFDEEITIGFNKRFLSDALKAIRDDEICVGFSGQNGPVMFKPAESDAYIHAILPVRL